MSIVKSINSNSSQIFIWHIVEDETTLLNLVDNRLLYGIEKAKKQHPKLQWLASRALLTEVLNSNNISFEAIKKDEFGKPFLSNCEWNFSISHSGNYAVLILSKNNFIGIDIETKFEQTYRLKEKFSTNYELDFIGNDSRQSALIWSAKESIYKAYGKKKLIFKEDMRLIDQKEGELNFHFSKTNSELVVTFIVEECYITSWINT